MPDMQPSPVAVHMVETFEGCVLNSYQDSGGKWTIGFGHTAGVTAGMSCTYDQARSWLEADLALAALNVRKEVKVPLSQPEFDALCDFTFNLGAAALARSTLLRLLNSGQPTAAADQFLRWVYCGGQILPGLVKRRAAERDLFLTGVSTVQRLQAVHIDQPE